MVPQGNKGARCCRLQEPPLAGGFSPANRTGQKDLESSAAELADRAGLCASRLIHLFQEQMGMAITEFRNRQKPERFLDLYHHDGRFNMLRAALKLRPVLQSLHCRHAAISP
jgi:AraC-like DNA-binding protein